MRVKVLFHGILSDWFGTPEAFLELPPGARLGELVVELRSTFGPRIPEQLWDAEGRRFGRQVLTTMGGKPVQDMDTPLAEDQELHLFLLLAGG